MSNIVDVDCWKNIIIQCKLSDILNLASICKFLYYVVNADGLWKIIMERDFNDLHKKDNETWLKYYIRRYINYGISITIGKNVTQFTQYNQVIQYMHAPKLMIVSFNIILTKARELYEISKDKLILMKHHVAIKKIYKNKYYFYFIDVNDDLYRLDYDRRPVFLRAGVINIMMQPHDNDVVYICDKGTFLIKNYDMNDVIKLFDIQIIDWVTIHHKDYYIDNNYNLVITTFLEKNLTYNFKVKKLYYSYGKLYMLGLDEFVYVLNNTQLYKIDIPYVDKIFYNSFLTKNGDLYYFNEDSCVFLLETDVIDCDFITFDGKRGHYVKRITY
jgi:hypothetical protein